MASQKISSFTAQSLLDSSDLFTFVRNGTNYNVPFSSLKADLGVTGDLSQTGDPLGAPILSEVSSNNYEIRNLESSKGVIASVSAQDGINLACNFTQPTAVGAINLIEDLNNPIYNFRGIKAVEPIEINVDSNGFIVFSEAASPLALTNTVVVSDITDFPDAVSGVITLEDDTNYILVQPITTSNRFVLGANNSITSNNPFSPIFTYTGSGTFFTGVDVNCLISYIAINAPSAKLFDISSPTSGKTFGLDVVTVVACDSVGDFNDLRSLNVDNLGVFSANDGITVSGTSNWSVFSLTKTRIESTSATFAGIDFTTSTHKTLEIIDPIIRAPSGAVGITGLASSGNITANEVATVTSGEFTGGLTPLSTISSDDVRWEFQGNAGITDSLSDALIGFNGNTTETVISTINTPVVTNAVWAEEAARRFTSTSGGRLTYDSEQTKHFPVDVAVGVISVGGGSTDITTYLALNGSVIANSGRTVNASGSKPRTLSIPWQLDLSENDYLEVFVENNSGTNNIIVENAILRIN